MSEDPKISKEGSTGDVLSVSWGSTNNDTVFVKLSKTEGDIVDSCTDVDSCTEILGVLGSVLSVSLKLRGTFLAPRQDRGVSPGSFRVKVSLTQVTF